MSDMSSDMAEALRKAISRSGHSANSIAKQTGVPQTVISRFMRGNNMGINHAGKLAVFLQLELRSNRHKS